LPKWQQAANQKVADVCRFFFLYEINI